MSLAQLGRRKLGKFNQTIANPAKIGPEHNPWFWNPSRDQFTKPDSRFMERPHLEMGEELEVTWNPILSRWQIWSKAPRIQHPICQGWKLLFIHNGRDGEYLPLDERVFARLYSASAAKWGDGKRYMDRIIEEFHREEARKNERLKQEAIDQAMPFWDHSQIKVAMRGKSSGDKFSTYHA